MQLTLDIVVINCFSKAVVSNAVIYIVNMFLK